MTYPRHHGKALILLADFSRRASFFKLDIMTS